MGKNGLFDILQNVQPSGTTTLDDLNITGLNNYEGTYAPGDVISYNHIGLMPAATSISTLNGVVVTFSGNKQQPSNLLTTSYDINVYELVYWGLDTRSSDTIRMSATLLIPTTIVDAVIVSYKHGTLGSTYQGTTLWNIMKSILDGDTAEVALVGGSVDSTPWNIATTGYVVVCADNPGYGTSLGFYNFLNTFGESYSQYNSVVAAQQLIVKESSLFSVPNNNVFGSPKFKVISMGYSMGGFMVLYVSQLIVNNTVFELINTIAGAPVNAYGLLHRAFYGESASDPLVPDDTYGTTATVLAILLLYANTGYDEAELVALTPAAITKLLPLFNQMYLNTSDKNIQIFANQLTAIAYKNGMINGSFRIIPSTIVGNTSLLSMTQEMSFYTNTFMDFSNLTGTPINVLYSLEDQLTCYKPSAPSVGGGAAFDQVEAPLATFVTTTRNETLIPGLITYTGNGLNRPGKYTLTDVVSTTGSIANDQVNNATTMLNSEGTENVINTRWNTVALNNITHTPFTVTIFWTTLRNYLNLRVA